MVMPYSYQIDTKPIFVLSHTVSVIIPAFNEATGIARVIDVLRRTAFISEIIVVDDGSKDQTRVIALQAAQEDARIQVITHTVNQGKGQSIFSGAHSCKNSIIVTLDGDLIGLKPEHIYALVKPVLEGKADMTLGIFKHGKLASDFSHWATPWLSGQRCFRLELLRHISPEAASGYGLETALTVVAQQKKWRCQHITWYGVSHPPSEFHRGKWRGFITRARMYAQILRAWYITTARSRVGKYLRSPLGFLLYVVG
jgi:glycosyltransferase involved in cell wall biosynthesis